METLTKTFSPKGKIFGPILPLFVLEKKISQGAKIVYALLCNFAGDKDHCWPAQGTLAAKVGCSVSTIKVHLQELQREKLIAIRQERFRSSTYYMLAPEGHPQAERTHRQRPEPKIGYREPETGYINNPNKINKYPPLPPTETRAIPSVIPQRKRGGGDFLPVNKVFEQFWAAYPKKEAKELARAVWHRLWRQGLLPNLEVMLKALERFRASAQWLKEHGRFVPQLVNWLKGQRWLDEPSNTDVPLAPEKTARQEHLQQALAHFERQEQARQAKHDDETIRLRPDFEKFLSHFSDDAAKMRGPSWGLWCLLHRNGNAPKCSDVPENAVDAFSFLKNWAISKKLGNFLV